MKPTISIIAALSENRVIGKNNQLLWHISEDLQRFKKLTLHHPVIMGRKTFESIGRPLSNRANIIVTRDTQYQVDGTTVVHSLEEAIREAKNVLPVYSSSESGAIQDESRSNYNEIFIIGGGQIFEQALPLADKLYLTIVKGNFPGDAFFPDYSEFKKVVSREEHKNENYEFAFVDLVRE